VRVVMLSKALVVGAYQRKLEELACLPGVELTVIVPPAWRDRRGAVTLERAYTAGYELIAAPLAFNGQYHLHWYPTLGRLLRRLRPDVLHVDEEPYNLATWHALGLGQALGSQGLFFTWQNLRQSYPWPFRYFEQVNYRRAAHAIAGNAAAADVLRAKGYRGPVSVIPQFGVDPALFTPRVEPSSVSRPAQFVIGYAGGLVPEKGIDLLIRACARLSGIDWALQVAGEGPARGALEALAGQLAVSERVRFWGRLPSTATPDFYRGLDVLALPSISRPNWIEQFGRVLVEAMACRVAVVGSTCGEIPHVISDAGVIFPEGDVGALVAALAGLAVDPARRGQLAEAGRARMMAHFTQAQIAAATYRVYGDMLRVHETRPHAIRESLN
jgi:glycosyltransferase involved in cell wall biosynthesis